MYYDQELASGLRYCLAPSRHFLAQNDVMTAIFKVWRHTRNPNFIPIRLETMEPQAVLKRSLQEEEEQQQQQDE